MWAGCMVRLFESLFCCLIGQLLCSPIKKVALQSFSSMVISIVKVDNTVRPFFVNAKSLSSVVYVLAVYFIYLNGTYQSNPF